MDIFQRTLRCHPQKVNEEEIEIFEADTENELEEEAEEEILALEEQLDPKIVMHELECMKKHIQKLQLHLKTKIEECPVEKCADYEIILNCSENKEICSLQKDNHKLQCQINELLKCCRIAKDHIEDLHLRICEKSKDILELQKHVATLMQWRSTLDHEFGKCIERFEYLKHVKAEWQDVMIQLDQQKKTYSTMERAFLPKLSFQQEKTYFIAAISDIKEMLKELFEYQLQRFNCLENRLDNVSGGQ